MFSFVLKYAMVNSNEMVHSLSKLRMVQQKVCACVVNSFTILTMFIYWGFFL